MQFEFVIGILTGREYGSATSNKSWTPVQTAHKKCINLLGGEADLRDWTVPQTAFEAHRSLASEADLPPNKLWTLVAFVLRSRPSMFLAGEALLALQLPHPEAAEVVLFSQNSPGEKCEVWAAVECEPAVALELVHPAGL